MKPARKGEALHLLEFLHSLGWTPLEVYRRGRLRHWRERCPKYKYRVRKYVPAKPARRREKR